MGLFYKNGCGVPQDKNTARRWYEKAAQQKHPEAIKELSALKSESGAEEKEPIIPIGELDIDINTRLGRGGFGIVYKGIWKSRSVAVKEAINVTDAQRAE